MHKLHNNAQTCFSRTQKCVKIQCYRRLFTSYIFSVLSKKEIYRNMHRHTVPTPVSTQLHHHMWACARFYWAVIRTQTLASHSSFSGLWGHCASVLFIKLQSAETEDVTWWWRWNVSPTENTNRINFLGQLAFGVQPFSVGIFTPTQLRLHTVSFSTYPWSQS